MFQILSKVDFFAKSVKFPIIVIYKYYKTEVPMKIINTPTPKYIVIFYTSGEEIQDFYTDNKGVTYHKISPANMRQSERDKYSSGFIYSR